MSAAKPATTPTPGPWVAVDLDGKHHAVAEQSTGIGLLYNGANARLIAASPCLLAALDGVLAQLLGPAMVHGNGIGNSGKKDGLSGEEFQALRTARIEAARAAIAKAKGGAK